VNARRPDALAFVERGGSLRITTNGGRDFAVAAEDATLAGEAPIAAAFIAIGETPFQPTWTGVTAWRTKLPLVPGDNRFELIAFDDAGGLLETASITVTSTLTWGPPSLTAVEPATGPEAGGTRVTVRGSGFHRGAAVRFGATGAVVESIAEDQIVAVTPAGTGAVSVRVTNLDGQSAELPAAFTFSRPRFVRGDADGDGVVRLADVIVTLEYLFRSREIDCASAADANDDGALDIRDPVRLLFRLFAGGRALPPPGPAADVDPTPDGLSCSRE
jgi:hypothetical protein